MFKSFGIKALLTFGFLLGSVLTHAQDKQIGGVFAFNELGATFRYANDENAQIELTANVDMNGVVSGKNTYPGGTLQFIYGFIFAQKTYPGGERLYGIAGPGVKAGYVKNLRGRYGAMAGVCGKIGLGYDFSLPVTLSVSLVPLLAFHVNKNFIGEARMDLHKFGLGASIFPHISILYRF